MINSCPYICSNKTEFGYCKTTGCINSKYNNITSNLSKQYIKTNGDRIRTMSDDELAEWMEDFAEAYVSFWIMPNCDFKHRKQDKDIQLTMLKSEYVDDLMFEF